MGRHDACNTKARSHGTATSLSGLPSRAQARRTTSNSHQQSEVGIMLRYALIFFVLALVAALFGFGGIAAGAVGIAKILFFGFLILAAVAIVANLTRGTV
jgi:uncharacterized membrane protein YtjA (UPF0391 family)